MISHLNINHVGRSILKSSELRFDRFDLLSLLLVSRGMNQPQWLRCRASSKVMVRGSNVINRTTLKSSQLVFEALQHISNLSFGLALLDNREKGFDRFDL